MNANTYLHNHLLFSRHNCKPTGTMKTTLADQSKMASLLSRRVSVTGTNKVKDKSPSPGTADVGAVDCSKHSDLGKKMTLQEKLDFIDGEIRKIHMFCTKSGYSASQIEHFAEPFLNRSSSHISSVIWVSGKAWKRRAVALTTVIVATLFLFRYDPAYKLASAISKQGAIQVRVGFLFSYV